jgi:pyruvate/oxaloacetate carboxyltransferase
VDNHPELLNYSAATREPEVEGIKALSRIYITDTILRDAHQSLIATRLHTEDMLPICPELDKVGHWSLEVWGGATFDTCLRFLKEDPWRRLAQLRKALPSTRLQMLLRGQNLVGYRHYADDVVRSFIQRAAANGIDVFRIFDALNDLRNLKTAIEAVKGVSKLAKGPSVTLSALSIISRPLSIKPKSWRRWAATVSQLRIWQDSSLLLPQLI